MNAEGAVGDCPKPRTCNLPRAKGATYCRCGKCRVCGNQKHNGLHMPPANDPNGAPWHHRFEAES